MKNRKIKFRAWFPSECFQDGKARMFYNQCISGNGKVMHLEGKWDYTGDEEKAIPMQFTGLTDKNGKEIYEGDILHKTGKMPMTTEPHIKQNWGQSPRKVVFHDGRFRFVKSKNSKDISAISVTIRQFGLEVIGNIYENTDLLQSSNATKQSDAETKSVRTPDHLK